MDTPQPSSLDLLRSRLRSVGLSEEQMQRRDQVARVSICFTSASCFHALLDESLPIADRPGIQSFFDACKQLSVTHKARLSKAKASCASSSKPYKIGSKLSVARMILGANFPAFAACALDAMLLQFHHQTKPSPDAFACIELLAKSCSGAPRMLLATCVNRCAYAPMPGAMGILLSKGFPPHGVGNNGHTSLFLAARHHPRTRSDEYQLSLECMRLLIAAGADPNEAGDGFPLVHARQSPLAAAISNDNWTGCHLLLDAGAHYANFTAELLAEPEMRDRIQSLIDQDALLADSPASERRTARSPLSL
jgi:hypothetical protein